MLIRKGVKGHHNFGKKEKSGVMILTFLKSPFELKRLGRNMVCVYANIGLLIFFGVVIESEVSDEFFAHDVA